MAEESVTIKACQLHGGYIGQLVRINHSSEAAVVGRLSSFEMHLKAQPEPSGNRLMLARLVVGGLTIDVPANRDITVDGHEKPIPVPEVVFAEG